MKIYVVIEAGGYWDLAFEVVTLVTLDEKKARERANNPQHKDANGDEVDTTYIQTWKNEKSIKYEKIVITERD